MKTLSHSVFTLISRLSEHLGPVTTVIDSLMDRLVGQQVAQACPGVLCDYSCTFLSEIIFNGNWLNNYWMEIDNYAPSPEACGDITCTQIYNFENANCPE